MTDLLNCPFCGGADVMVLDVEPTGQMSEYSHVHCCDCMANGPVKPSDDAADAAWNRRAPLSALPGEAEVWGWAKPDHEEVVPPIAWRGSELPAWATSVFTTPLVTLASLQAIQTRAEKTERERDAFLVKLSAALGGLSRYINEQGDRRTDEDWAAFLLSRTDALRLSDHDNRRRAVAAEARVKDLEEALNLIDALEPEEHLFGFGVSHDACRGLVAHMGEIARTALKGGSNG